MNSSNVEGAFDQAKGKVKQAFGEATGNESVANSGAADEVKGHAKETWGDIKDTASNVGNKEEAHATTTAHQEGETFRDKVTSAAEHAKDSIKSGLDKLEHKTDK